MNVITKEKKTKTENNIFEKKKEIQTKYNTLNDKNIEEKTEITSLT